MLDYTKASSHGQYTDREDFLTRTKDSWPNQEVIAQGVSDEEAMELTRSTPPECRIKAAVKESCDHEGRVDPERRDYNIRQTMFYLATHNNRTH